MESGDRKRGRGRRRRREVYREDWAQAGVFCTLCGMYSTVIYIECGLIAYLTMSK